MSDALSIEQNNKVRVALGLKPLPVPGARDGPVFKESKDEDGDASSDSADEDPGSTLESRAAQGYENWNKYQEEAQAKQKREARNDAIRKARESAQRMAKLEGKGLGEADGDNELDTKGWLKQHKKMQKKLEKERARKLAEELADREQMATAEYTAEDLAGVKVGHEMGEFDESGEQVLTLKDTTIDENEQAGDELENIGLRETEQTKERLEGKKKRTAYDPLATDGDGSILAQYDEEIEGKKRKHFTLDSKPMTAAERDAKRQDVSSKLNSQGVRLDDIDIPEPTPSDYQEPAEIKVKKPKKKKSKTARRKAADDDDIFPTIETGETPTGGQSNGDSMDVDIAKVGRAPSAASRKRPSDEDESFVDDEDLQASLAAQRRAAFKKRKTTRPEDIARQFREESEQAANAMDEDKNNAEEDGGLVIDETSEFVSNLQRPTVPERQQRSASHAAEEPTAESPPAEEGQHEDVDMDRSYDEVEDEGGVEELAKRDESTHDMTTTGLDEEGTLNQGIGATLSVLKQRGLVKHADDGDASSLHRDRQRFLLEKQQREAEADKRARTQRERDRASGKFDRMSARDREEHARWENKQRDQQESRQVADVFNREYKPDVQLKYVDEFGRAMDQKEAFKKLSHQFHGKGSGKMKTEKHLKKIDDEKKRESMSTLDSSQNTGMNNAMGATARRNRQAGVRLG